MKKWRMPVLLALAVVAAFWAVVAAAKVANCHWYGYQTDRTVRYAAFTGCLVKMPTGWTPRYELRTEQ